MADSLPTLSLCQQLFLFDVIMSGRGREGLRGRETVNICKKEINKKKDY